MYKIIYNNKVIDVIKCPQFVRFLPYGHIAFTDRLSAHGIVGSDEQTIYSFGRVFRPDIKIVSIEVISEEEFSRLNGLLNSNQEVSADEFELNQAKQAVITQLSYACKTNITSGFNITLCDGIKYNFKLTAEDQLNLMNIESQLNAGAETFIYHATGLPCQIFNREDMQKIIQAFRRVILYHTTYFNAAKQYINTLTDTSKVRAFTYGTNITHTVKDLTIKQILKRGGTIE